MTRQHRPGKRQQLARFLMGTGGIDLLARARRRSRLPWLTALTYHRIAERHDGAVLDPETIDATPAQFESQIAFLAQRFHFVGVDDVMRYLDGGTLPGNSVLITFDDGYLECFERALPILKRYDARATFFIATGFTEDRSMMWWDKLMLSITRCRKERIELDYPDAISLDLSDRGEAATRLLTIAKTRYALDIDRFLVAVERACEVRLDPDEERDLVDRSLMTWSQVAALADAGMDIGSHTATHRVLQTLSAQQLRQELEGSRRMIETRIGRTCQSIAYPVGYALDGALRVRRALRNAGYRVGFSNNTGFNVPLGRPDPFDIRRVGMSVSFETAYFQALCAIPPFARSRRGPLIIH